MEAFSSQDDIQKWREKAASHAPSALPDDTSICAQLCRDCVAFYRRLLCQLIESALVPKPTLTRITRNFETLVLWADGYDVTHGRLDWVFAGSRTIRRGYLQSMNSVCTTLLERLLPLYPEVDMDGRTRVLRKTLEYGAQCLDETYQDDESTGSRSDTSRCFPGDNIHEIIRDLEVDMDCLLDMDPLFTSPALDRVAEEQVATEMRMWASHQTICDRIASMFPEAEEEMIQRVGKATWASFLRCKNLRENNDGVDTTDCSEPVARTVITSLRTLRTEKTKDSGLGSSVFLSHDGYTIDVKHNTKHNTKGPREVIIVQHNTKSTYDPAEPRPSDPYRAPGAAASATKSSQAGSYAHLEDDSIEIPALPNKALAGKPFECIACGKRVMVRTELAWRTHLFQDLRPYVCPVERCPPATVPFKSRHEFLDHITASHHELHLPGAGIQCPLCRDDIGHDIIHVTKHLGHHLEEISVKTLTLHADVDLVHDSEMTRTPRTDVDLEERATGSQGSDQSGILLSSETDNSDSNRNPGFDWEDGIMGQDDSPGEVDDDRRPSSSVPSGPLASPQTRPLQLGGTECDSSFGQGDLLPSPPQPNVSNVQPIRVGALRPFPGLFEIMKKHDASQHARRTQPQPEPSSRDGDRMKAPKEIPGEPVAGWKAEENDRSIKDEAEKETSEKEYHGRLGEDLIRAYSHEKADNKVSQKEEIKRPDVKKKGEDVKDPVSPARSNDTKPALPSHRLNATKFGSKITKAKKKVPVWDCCGCGTEAILLQNTIVCWCQHKHCKFCYTYDVQS